MDITVLLDACNQLLPSYVRVVEESSPYERKGIFFSELLLAAALIGCLDIRRVIESGRSRGQSTEILGRFCGDRGVAFDSIELIEDSDDARVAEERLADLNGVVTLHYGDAFELLPRLRDARPTLILIDGPKGPLQEWLCIQSLRDPAVRAVLLHDTSKDKEIRGRLEAFFPGACIYSDNYDFVARFGYLDADCWKKYLEENRESPAREPYRGRGQRLRSYGPTLAAIFREKVDLAALDEYEAELHALARRTPWIRRAQNYAFGIARKWRS